MQLQHQQTLHWEPGQYPHQQDGGCDYEKKHVNWERTCCCTACILFCKLCCCTALISASISAKAALKSTEDVPGTSSCLSAIILKGIFFTLDVCFVHHGTFGNQHAHGLSMPWQLAFTGRRPAEQKSEVGIDRKVWIREKIPGEQTKGIVYFSSATLFVRIMSSRVLSLIERHTSLESRLVVVRERLSSLNHSWNVPMIEASNCVINPAPIEEEEIDAYPLRDQPQSHEGICRFIPRKSPPFTWHCFF